MEVNQVSLCVVVLLVAGDILLGFLSFFPCVVISSSKLDKEARRKKGEKPDHEDG